MAVVTVQELSKSYEGERNPAVKEVSFTVGAGEFMVLLGPSGCGKSSVLRMIAGIEPVTAGKISIDGKVINALPAKDRDIAMVFQSYALYPHMDVFDNLAFGLRRRRVPLSEVDRRVLAASEKLGLTPYLKRKPNALSGGQRQRVALGRAIVREPKVFLFDEPLSNLDASLRLTMRNELIRQQAELGTTTIYVTHDQVEAMTMGHRLCIMNQGEIVQIGRPLEVYRNPINTFAARFLGSPQMNLLKAGISRDDGQYTVNLAGTVVRIPGGSPAAATGHKESSILVGIRPEDLYDVQPAMPAERLLQIQTRVLAVEPLGPETILLLMVEVTHEELIARVGRETPIRRGEQVTIFGDTFALHWFDPVTSNAIDLRSCQSAGQINLQEHS